MPENKATRMLLPHVCQLTDQPLNDGSAGRFGGCFISNQASPQLHKGDSAVLHTMLEQMIGLEGGPGAYSISNDLVHC